MNNMMKSNKFSVSTNSVKAIPHLSVQPSFLLITVLTASGLLLLSFVIPYDAVAQGQSQLQRQEQQQPNIKASYIHQTQKMVVGNNIKNLVILIPNEAHEDTSQIKETRLLNQTYLPENAVVNVGTTVAWLNADAGHRHSITLVDDNTKNIVFNSGRFDNYNASKPFTLNNVGTFAYSGPSYDRAFPNYKMNGTITVAKQPLASTFNTTTVATDTTSTPPGQTSNNTDTVAILITPAKLLDKTISGLNSQGITIDSQYPFMSLRGGGSASGGDKQQVLLVLTSSGKSLNQVTSSLGKVAATLPYK
jgi:plastocyanin